MRTDLSEGGGNLKWFYHAELKIQGKKGQHLTLATVLKVQRKENEYLF